MNTQIASSLKETQISHLITDLGDDNGLVRQRARLQLEHLGLESIPALLEALQSQNVHVRWEALRALGELHAPETAASIRPMELMLLGLQFIATGPS